MFNSLDLIVRDVPAATAFFRDVLGLEVRFADDRFAQLESGSMQVMLSPDAMVPTEPARGVILHLQVDDVEQALIQAQGQGTTIWMEPTTTDRGRQSAMMQGPEGIVIDFYRPGDPP